jgi:MoaA/NifB/PqqE/SkfB family radical SAM enzyme
MCIRSENSEWQFQDMPLADFRKILPYLKDVETVVLEGWGESLLHEDLAECIRLAKKEGPKAGFVTSGKGLTETRVSELMEAGVDFVGFSIAGATAETHEAIRVNSHLPEVLEAIALFQAEKKRRALLAPKLHMTYLMVKDNMHETPSIPALAKEAGIEEVILIHICHTINRWQKTQQIFTWKNDPNPYEEILRTTLSNAKKLGIRINKPALNASDVPLCAENPLRNLYISAEGEVSPCVYLFPPLPSPFFRNFCGREYRTDKVSFGNIFKEPFPAIWNSKEYQQFRESFRKREQEQRELFLSMLTPSMMTDRQQDGLSDPPAPCRTCHKILGF